MAARRAQPTYANDAPTRAHVMMTSRSPRRAPAGHGPSGGLLGFQSALQRPDSLPELVENDAHGLKGLMQVCHSPLPRLAFSGVLGELVKRVAIAHPGTILQAWHIAADAGDPSRAGRRLGVEAIRVATVLRT